jgi:hypothetical protein
VPELGPSNQSSVPASRRFFRRINSALLRWDALYRLYLKLKFGAKRLTAEPAPYIANATLKSRAEAQQAFENAVRLHLPRHRTPEKNWDHLAAVSTILSQTSPSARILDAGAELYSNVLPALFLYGYRDLYGINLSFTDPARRGPIRYLPGDLTNTSFPDESFDAIACLSVIEHGVPLEAYFREMHRLGCARVSDQGLFDAGDSFGTSFSKRHRTDTYRRPRLGVQGKAHPVGTVRAGV